MASQPWHYVVPYSENIQEVLARLRPHEYQGDASEIKPLSDLELVRCFGTTKPTREVIDDNLANAAEEDEDLYQNINRGQGVYLIIYKDAKPDGIFFGGYTYD